MTDTKQKHKYCHVTETPETRGSKEQINRLYIRYRFASEFCKGKEVLEVACGAGLGLGYLGRSAKRVVGGDIDESNLNFARQTYKGRNNIKLCLLNAEQLPFDNKSFDVVILYEAIYYLQYPEKFVDEARRILRSKGLLLICSANKDWSDFNPSPYGIGYFSVPELYSLIETRGFMVVMLADSPVSNSGLRDKLISLIKRTAVRFHLIPGTLSGREKLKRLFFGELKTLPSEITDGMAEYTPPLPISPDIPNKDYKVIYAVGHVR